MILYYHVIEILSVILSGIFLLRWSRGVSVHFAIIFIFIPIINLGYLKLATAETISEALLANGIIYLDGCFLELFYFLFLMSFCKLKVPKPLTAVLMIFSSVIYYLAINTGQNKLLYTSAELQSVDGVSYVVKEYGPVHTVYYIMIGMYVLANLGVLIYGFIKKDVSKRNILLLFMMYMLIVTAFFIGRSISPALDLIPASFLLSQIIFLIIIGKISIYDVSGSAFSTIAAKGDIGFVSFDLKRHYLGCTEPALQCFPELSDLYVDEPLKSKKESHIIIHGFLDAVEKSDEDENPSFFVNVGETDYKVTAGYMYSGKRIAGYQLRIEDNTKEKKYIDLLNNYKSDLEKEVRRQTEHIQEIMDKFVMGMAEMVQNRDNNTGGHIKRTSSVVRILVGEMKKDPELTLTDDFYENVIKAAPMHDLGKIAVDDAILRKPGKFTPEEYEEMKTHAAKGAEIVESILGGVDDPEFVEIAINVAHYHHERYDGSGYPTGISGENIPIEARIMAIADVYDALVSKRCYKDEFSFEKAYSIIEEGMGTQFDPKLNEYFVNSREKIENYYLQTRQEE